MSTYHQLMSAGLSGRPARLEDLLARPTDPERLAAYASGEIATRPALPIAERPQRRLLSRFRRPQPQRSPDREKSIRRRRTLAATWPMPPAMAGLLTTSQVAYARIVSDEVHRTGDCRLTLDEIAARGGMCRKTAKRAQDRLAELRWISVDHRPVPGRKHLSNIVRVLSAEWLSWIKMGPKPRRTGGHSCPATENQSSSSMNSAAGERPKRALERATKRWRPPTEHRSR